MKKDITALFCFVDDFVKLYYQKLQEIAISSGQKPRNPTRVPSLRDSEIVTILLMFQISPAKNFKYFYQSYLQSYNNNEFRKLPSYERFVALKKRVAGILAAMLQFLLVSNRNIGYVDASGLAVCHAKRTRGHKVFRGLAKLGKTTKGWFFGLKLHLVISEKGELINVAITAGNVDDRKPVPKLTEDFIGLLLGDKGYISQDLFQELYAKGVKLITGIKKNMKNTLMSLYEKMLLRKRSIIETVFGYLKHTMQLEHTRHRSPINAFIHILSTLIMYQKKSSKPSVYFAHMLPA